LLSLGLDTILHLLVKTRHLPPGLFLRQSKEIDHILVRVGLFRQGSAPEKRLHISLLYRIVQVLRRFI